jgi:hypothetical protein
MDERRCGMTLEDAIELLRKEYEKASNTNYVNRPLSCALYHTWKKVDSEKPTLIRETDLTDKCGSCEWAMPIKGSFKGVFGSYVECQNPNKAWKYDTSSRKQRTTQKCRMYQKKEKGGE